MRISDWSSDVCSSDLLIVFCKGNRGAQVGQRLVILLGQVLPVIMVKRPLVDRHSDIAEGMPIAVAGSQPVAELDRQFEESGRASCRERLGQYVEIWVVAVSLHKLKNKEKKMKR